MNAYASMKKLISNLNRRFDEGRVNEEQYSETATTYAARIDTFFACGRMTSEQYSELIAEIKTF